ncbi:PAQR family membrane homeostasis protein TrhA [Desulfotalea psychrophila]|uniref:Related to hemolysin III n=1 Tax=Desulfotalea psychrophila (strain LSv54 / DSM 12343) TaxID=177439 RepID=Q6AM22_DESPS|nr:hemolysin III family protein [Desulfotalea psychrophila]CAG36603.1 related to hemolysin III [Desulfotalea psychrophila LSv54]
MTYKAAIPAYGRVEERLNVLSHGLGALGAVVGFCYLLHQAFIMSSWPYWLSATVFGGGMVLMLTSSTLYHLAKKPVLRKWLRRCDHGMIFIFIAATYTPFTLLALQGDQSIFWTAIIWSIALLGIIVAFIPFKHKVWVEIPLCLGLGWLAIFLYGSFSGELGLGGHWLFAGGVVYSVGALLYLVKKMPFNHAIWHCFVLAGLSCHYVAISAYLMT